MPTYEYLCKGCSHRFEIWQKMADESLTVCPKCGGTLRRVLFPAGIVFKGSGFYKTDHGSGSVVSEGDHAPKSEGAEAAKETAKEAEKKTDAGSESKSKSGTESSSAKSGESKVTVESK